MLWETVRAEQICRMFRDGELAEKTQDDATGIRVEVKQAEPGKGRYSIFFTSSTSLPWRL